MISIVNKILWVRIPPLNDNIKQYYLISNTGLVYSEYTKSYIIPHENHAGYLQVSLMTETGRVFRKVHRLVMICFSPIPNYELYEVNHKDGIKYNNCICNLEWVTSKQNKHHAIKNNLANDFIGENNPKNKISEEDAYTIGKLLLSRKYTDTDIMNIVSTCPNKEIIRNIANGNTWKHLFTDEEISIMKLSREGKRLTIEEIHKICKFYKDNKDSYIGYGAVKQISIDALKSINLPVTDTFLRLAKRLYYKYDNKAICNLYKY